MSKVQSPKSNAVIESLLISSSAGTKGGGFGPWTLDFGLKVCDLRKSFLAPSGDRIEVLRGVSFFAQPGEAIAILGSSGAGKSTLLHVLAGLEEPDHGSIVAGDFALNNASPSALAHFRNRLLGLIFQFHHLLKDLTALENVSLPLMINRKSPGEASAAAGIMLETVGLGSRSSHLIGDLSGGEQQRVAVCRALVTRPHMVLADEPTGNLDSATGDAIAASLVSYAKETPAIVIVATHNQNLASLCDRSLVLRDGRLYET
ncbi:MAG: ABC transporter ATP-binding protein [Acidobacteriota bacterium]